MHHRNGIGAARARVLGVLLAALAAGACSANAGGPPLDAGRRDTSGDRQQDTARADALDAGGDTGAVTMDTGVAPADTTPADTGPADTGVDTTPVDTGPPRCGPGIDSDGDGLTNDDECMRGTDPFRRDSDMDGIADGVEVRYPRACVATTPTAQRRPTVACMTDADCRAGERCVGLDPARMDTDGDGVIDGQEDRNYDGRIDGPHGETDPRIADTDGDGRSDAMGGLEICRPAGLASVTQLGLPMTLVQIGHDPRWGTARRAPGSTMRAGVVMEDAATGVAGAVFSVPTLGDLRAESMRVETAVTAALGAGVTPVLVGRAIQTHEMHDGVTSTYRVGRATDATTLRDGVARGILGASPPAGATVGASSEFLVDVTTVRRATGLAMGTTDVIVTVAPRADYENPARETAIRALDLVNTTGVAQLDRGLGANCQVFRADRVPAADFLWTVDTSGSMSDDQVRLGNTATQFFTRLRAAGVDFRVGVLNAGSGTLNLDSPGFRWISGTDPTGARTLCEQVTYGTCPTSPGERLAPYTFAGGAEEPTAAAIIAHNTFLRRGMMGETNLDRRFRPGARVVTFHVTDEPGSNDFSRYFQRSSDPQTGTPWGSTYNTATLNNIIAYFRRNMVLTFGLVPRTTTPCSSANVYDLPRCVIEGNGGAVIPITTATDPEVAAAMSRIVDAIAGASSQFVLERTPITSTLKVRLRGMDVPRSRAEGFDYDGASRAIVFYGTRYRPNMGDEVVVSYRIWQPCPAVGAACTTDGDCCAPNTCTDGRCSPPCSPTGGMCTTNADCCSPNTCQMGRCTPPPTCIPRGGTCTESELRDDCCPPYRCVGGTCGEPVPCRPTDAMCTRNTDCCSGTCTGGRCACRMTGGRCTTPLDCCSRYCVDGLCGPG